MERLKKFFLLAAGLGLLAVVVTVLGTKPAHALIATLVQVVNTSAQPVPTLATDALSSFGVTGSCFMANGTRACEITPIYTVPAGQIAVIESTSGVCFYNAGNLNDAFLQFQNATNTTDILLERTHGNAGSGAVETWTHSVKGYAFGGSSGTAINAHVFFDSPEDTGNCFIAISGHLISQ
jgi:hypothetical protein